MYVIGRYFHIHHIQSIILADLPYQLFRSFSKIRPIEDLFPVLGAPYQVVARVVDRMTRSLDGHAERISYCHARAYADKGDAPLPLITPCERHAFIPAASRGGFCKELR